MSTNFASGTVWTGDNLVVMRGMNDACVDLIYLDPPFNSNRNYEAPIGSEAAGAAFKDAWMLDDVDVHEHGELADRNSAAHSVIEAAREAHGRGMMAYLIMMAVRLLEMRRILKPSGSIYLHCDPTASHYLKLLMDGIFGSTNFRNEIVWHRSRGKGLNPRKYVSNCDRILYYAVGNYTWSQQYEPFGDGYGASWEKDSLGPWQAADLTGGKAGGPSAYLPFNGILPGAGRAWAPPVKEKFPPIAQQSLPSDYSELNQLDKLKALNAAGLIYWPKKQGGKPRYKKYLSTLKGLYTSDLIQDIPPISAHAKERTGYPTQKPVALLDRILKTSSNPGDMVLDPFCGCATVLVAADRLDREWAGIDLSPLAAKLVNDRIRKDRGPLWQGPTIREDPPLRTDLGDLPNYRTHRHRLYGEQEGICAGCRTHFPFKVMEVDHILPQAQGGTDHADNLQLLCVGCNRSKGQRTMAEWRAAQSRSS